MTSAWINLSTHWGLTSVQAALNVIISVLSTIGIWSFSRYWWQREATRILQGGSEIRLSALITLSSPGEGWDVVAMLRKRIWSRENWRLLLQLVVVISVTLACMLSGPIAKVSLRSSRTVQTSDLEVLESIKGDSSTANLLEANVLWNETIRSINQAGFPDNQLLDYLPPSTAAWIYVAREWNPTWSMTCSYTEETSLHNVTGSGNYTFYDPINAFPAYQDTYDQSWLNTSKYRIQANFCGWSIPTFQDAPFRDFLFFILIQSDPEKDNRMYTNNQTLQISMSVLHVQNFTSSVYNDVGDSGETTWKPDGPVGNASFSRVECNITRKLEVSDENVVPWIWTNDTYSITLSYRNFWLYSLEEVATKSTPISTPTPQDLLRFYQTYMATVNTEYSLPSLRRVSVWMDTVQLSSIFLGMVVLLTLLALWQTSRYFWFLRRHKSKLNQVFVPDGKMEWMVHAAKVAAHDTEEENIEGKRAKDRDYFSMANFGYNMTGLESSDAEVRPPGLARVYTSRSSISGASPSKLRGSLFRGASHSFHPPLTVSLAEKGGRDKGSRDGVTEDEQREKEGQCLKRIPSFVELDSKLELTILSAGESSQSGS